MEGVASSHKLERRDMSVYYGKLEVMRLLVKMRGGEEDAVDADSGTDTGAHTGEGAGGGPRQAAAH